jgi:Ca2+/Na+ antiporter
LINWVGVGINALWVLGTAGVLASFSYTSWWAHERGVPLRQALGDSIFRLPFSLSMALTCLGLFFCARGRLERALWLVLIILFIVQAHLACRGKRKQ